MDKGKKVKNRKAKKVTTKNLENNYENSLNNNKKKKSKRGWKVFRVLLFVLIAICIVGAGIVFGVISGIVNDTTAVTLAQLANEKQTSFAYANDGTQIGRFFDSENRIIVERKDIPQSLVDAVVAIEDERFFEHSGIDIKRTAGAIFTFVLNGGSSTFGGSTITQQLVKNVTEDKETSWKRKIREWYRAISLEKLLDKDQIITLYLNKIYLGDGCHGVAAASEDFFGKNVSDIDIAQSAVLAAAIQSPESTNPYASNEAREKLLNRQKIVLSKMLSLGKISNEEYEAALNEEITFKKGENEEVEVQSYFVDAVFNDVVEDLMELKDVEKGIAKQMLYTQGYKIYTTMDPKVQNAIDSAYNNQSLFYTDSAGDFMQSAMVVIEQSTGNVVGLIGGADKKTGALTLNRATQLKRQLGSCAKPICAYGPAFEAGVLSPGSGIDDSALNGENTKNYYLSYNGYVTVRNAIARSMNLPAVRSLRMVDLNTAFNFAKNCGLKTLVENDKNRTSFALGGFDQGITVLEAANAYATIANKGVYIEPKLYTKVEDAEGNVILSNENSTAKVVMKESTSYMLTSCLQTVVQAGTATGYVRMNNGGIEVAGKTGNTNGDIDQWFCGFTPYYTIACWNGYDNVGGKAGTKAIDYRTAVARYPYTAIPLFNTVMNEICKDLPAKSFDRPNTVTYAELCRVSGMVGTDACKKDQRGSQIGSDLVEVGKAPTATCNIHKMVKVCKVTGKIAGENCTNTEERSYITRDGNLANLSIKSADSGYLAPTEVCTTCKKIVEKPKEDNDNEVNIYKLPTTPTKPTKPSDTTTTTTTKK